MVLRPKGVDITRMKIAVAGSGGRMGRALLEAVNGGDDVELAAALEAAGSPFLGKTPANWSGHRAADHQRRYREKPCRMQRAD